MHPSHHSHGVHDERIRVKVEGGPGVGGMGTTSGVAAAAASNAFASGQSSRPPHPHPNSQHPHTHSHHPQRPYPNAPYPPHTHSHANGRGHATGPSGGGTAGGVKREPHQSHQQGQQQQNRVGQQQRAQGQGHERYGRPAAGSVVGSRPQTASSSPRFSASSSPSAHSFITPYPHPPPLFASCQPYLNRRTSPSRLDGLSGDEERILRSQTCVFISEMGKTKKLGQLVVATAQVFLQVFFTRYSFKQIDRLDVACACLFLASKVEEKRTRVDDVINAYYQQRETLQQQLSAVAAERGEKFELDEARPIEAMRQRVAEIETILLDAIEYNFDILHPYSYLRKFIEKYIFSPHYCKAEPDFLKHHLNDAGGIAQIAWNWVNDSLRTTLCLQFGPSQLCVAAIQLSIQHLIMMQPLADPPKKPHQLVSMPMKTPPDPDPAKANIPWYTELFGMDKKMINRIESLIMKALEDSSPDSKRPYQTVDHLLVARKARVGEDNPSVVPLPAPRLQMAQAAKHMAQQARGGGKPQHGSAQAYAARTQQNNAARGAAAGSKPAASTTSSTVAPPVVAGTAAPHRHDRKRPRSPVDSSRRPTARPSPSHPPHSRPPRSPLPRPPSPFLDADNQRPWLPDLDRHRRHDRERDRDRDRDRERGRDRRGRDGDKDKDRTRDRERVRGDSEAMQVDTEEARPDTTRPSRSHSRHRSHSRGRERDRDRHHRSRSREPSTTSSQTHTAAAAASSTSTSATISQPLPPLMEEGEIVDSEESAQPPTTQTVERGDGSNSTVVLSPTARLAPSTASLTKSSSSFAISSLATATTIVAAPLPSRLSSSASMSNLATASGLSSSVSGDILNGDILRMSSALASPASDAALALAADSGDISMSGAVDEKDITQIMKDINRGTQELAQEKGEEGMVTSGVRVKQERDAADVYDDGNGDSSGRQTKRPRLHSRPQSPSSSRSLNDLDGAGSLSASPMTTDVVSSEKTMSGLEPVANGIHPPNPDEKTIVPANGDRMQHTAPTDTADTDMVKSDTVKTDEDVDVEMKHEPTAVADPIKPKLEPGMVKLEPSAPTPATVSHPLTKIPLPSVKLEHGTDGQPLLIKPTVIMSNDGMETANGTNHQHHHHHPPTATDPLHTLEQKTIIETEPAA